MTVNLRLLMHLVPVSSKRFPMANCADGILCRASPPHSIDRRSWRGEWLLATALTDCSGRSPASGACEIEGAGGQGEGMAYPAALEAPVICSRHPGGAGTSGGSEVEVAVAAVAAWTMRLSRWRDRRRWQRGRKGQKATAYIGSVGHIRLAETEQATPVVAVAEAGAPDAYDYIVGTSVSGSL